jgi:hypothetical protein
MISTSPACGLEGRRRPRTIDELTGAGPELLINAVS